MIITIASGKGGTGKTTFSVNLSHALSTQQQNVKLLDCDVEEPNSHLFLNPDFETPREVFIQKPVWDASKCVKCGKCQQHCNYNAIIQTPARVMVLDQLCHACGVCSFVCPSGALTEHPARIGVVRTAKISDHLSFADGLLDIGLPSAPALIKEVKNELSPDAINIIDAAPGAACTVVEALDNSDAAVLVTEPTPFGLYDLKLAVETAIKTGTNPAIVINRSGLSDYLIEEYAKEKNVPIIGKIPFDRKYAKAYSEGKILADTFPEISTLMLEIFEEIKKIAAQPARKPSTSDEYKKQIPASPRPQAAAGGTSQSVKEIVVISGKGGTGKTTVLSSLAALTKNCTVADNDVDASDLHLLAQPQLQYKEAFFGGSKASIDADKCKKCGKCLELCHFGAIYKTEDGTCQVVPHACEGCGMCKTVCEFDAVNFAPACTGHWFESDSQFGPMVHASLAIAEENSGKLVGKVRTQAKLTAQQNNTPLILEDGPPGTGCPVIASISGADMALIVSEPTVSGVHDLERVLRLTKHFQVPAKVVLNKADLNPDQAAKTQMLCDDFNAQLVANIPFDDNVHHSLVACKTVVEWDKGPAASIIKGLHKKLKTML